MALDGFRPVKGFMLQQAEAGAAINLPESLLLYKRPASHPTGIPEGLTDFADITEPGVSFALSGPSVKLDPAHLPVRGDLAHIRLAGKVFVPHYVVPMAHVVTGGAAPVLKAGRDDGEVVAELADGTLFNVLDVAGNWAWGQENDDGVVGYVAAASLKPVE